MPEWLSLGDAEAGTVATVVLLRLLGALALGGVVAVIYRLTRRRTDTTPSFTVTLVLLAILIAMVTQVIGNNVARAFSLVGALSIVRFRTVVRDTQDTAYVIFAVAVGMAMGAGNPTVAAGGIVVVAIAAFAMRPRSQPLVATTVEDLPFELVVRMGLGADPDSLLGATLDRLGVARRLMTVATARQGLAVDVGYRAAIRDDAAADLVNALNKVEGVQGVTLQRVPPADGG